MNACQIPNSINSYISTTTPKEDARIVAFVDGTNLHKRILELGWKLDYKKFKRYLAERFGVGEVFLFLGYIAAFDHMYRNFRALGYSLVWKPTYRGRDGTIKGNCDTELAVCAVAGCCENQYQEAVLVTADGDFNCLTDFLAERGKLRAIVAPSRSSCSWLLKRGPVKPTFLDCLRGRLEFANGGSKEGSTSGSKYASRVQPNYQEKTADDPYAAALGLTWPTDRN
jgi:uncharacterized LabA/DUF88 family protein